MTFLNFLNKKKEQAQIVSAQTLPDPITMHSCKVGPNGFVTEIIYRSPLEVADAIYWCELAKKGINRCPHCQRPENDHSEFCEVLRARKWASEEERRLAREKAAKEIKDIAEELRTGELDKLRPSETGV